MCYKVENQKKLSTNLSDKLKEVPEFISDFFDRYKSAVTSNCNWGYIKSLLQWLIDSEYIQRQSINDITVDDMNGVSDNHIIKYLNGLLNGSIGRSNSLDSINTKKNVFSAFWSYMFKQKYVDSNIISNIPGELYKSETTDVIVVIPTEEQLDNFSIALSDGNKNDFNIIRNLSIVKLFLGSGIRLEELINIDIKDLHLEGGRLLKTNKETTRPFINILGKGKKEQYDSVFISLDAKKHLTEYIIARQVFVEENDIKSNALFLSNSKNRISRTAITSFFERYSNGEITPHMLRHWVGTELYRKTKDIVLVQTQLRHEDLETTRKFYVHMSDETVADAVSEL